MGAFSGMSFFPEIGFGSTLSMPEVKKGTLIAYSWVVLVTQRGEMQWKENSLGLYQEAMASQNIFF